VADGEYLDEKQKQQIRKMYADGFKKIECARRFRVSPQTVSRTLASGKTSQALKGAA